MNIHRLKASTSLILCMALIAPGQTFAQGNDRGYPCVAPSGEEVNNANKLSRALIDYLNAGEVVEDLGTCGADAYAQALESGGDELSTILEASPDAVKTQAIALIDGAAQADVDAATTQESASADSSGEVDAEATAEAEPEAEAEEEAAEAEPEEEAEVEAEAAEAEADEPVAENAADTQAETSPEDAETAAAEATTETAEPEQAGDMAASEDSAAAQDTAEATDTAPAAETGEAAQPELAESGDQAAPESEATEQASQAGEAGGNQLTDAERQELAQARAEENAAGAAAAATVATEAEADSGAPEVAEVETQTVTEEDVRRSDEDFETSAAGSATEQTESAALAGDDGLSNFEKALLLGLGAAVVGSILDNGDEVVSNSGDRIIIERDGELRVLKNDDELLRRPGAQVQTQTFGDGSTRTVVTYEDGRQIITVRANDGAVLRRTLIRASDGEEIVLFDDTETVEPVDFDTLPQLETIEKEREAVNLGDQIALKAALRRSVLAEVDRNFSLRQIRDYKRVRALAPQVELDAVTFATGSAAISPSQAEALSELGFAMSEIIENDPSAVFLVEGHTDAVGRASYNLALSDRRAETVALALTEYFDVPPQNLITQGYGETDLKVPVLTDERANRRAVVRNITDLLD